MEAVSAGAAMERGTHLDELCGRIQQCIAPFAGRVEYGNLRSRVSNWDCGDGECVTNLALVYETPGGSTDQINISYHHKTAMFSLIDEEEGEFTTDSIDVVLNRVEPRISGIPKKRLETLYAEIRRQLEAGNNTAGVVGHLNRMIQSEFKGGSITHLEFKDAMTYAVQFLKSDNRTA
jgi:hypothetical protein